MKKIYSLAASILLIILTTAPFSGKAQVDTSTVQKLLQYIMQPLDKSQIPTGFLEEYGAPIIPMETFNGTLTDSNRIDMNLWRTLYFQLQTGWAETGSNPLPAITTVNTTIKNNTGDTVAIPILLGSYNTVKSYAFTNNLLSYNSSQNKVYDVSGRPESPYDTKNLFAAAPAKKISKYGTEIFVVKNNMIWNNTGKTISSLQINFDNGSGFQTIAVGTPVTINYTDTGYKRWTIKVTLNDATVRQCYSNYYVQQASSVGSRFSTASAVVPSWGTVSPTSSYCGATVSVVYSSKSYTGTLRKPLIVVEGYDVSNILPDLQSNYNVSYFIDALDDAIVPGWNFNDQLDDIAGYDLVFIDFNDGTDDIIRNAAVVQEVINRVNTNKVNDARFGNIRQQNVVLGLSMGGLCARYALANMTKNFTSIPTETRLLITHDSPHRGANVPLGAQYLIRMVGGAELFGTNVRDIFPEYDNVVSLLDEPATQQMLIYRSLTTTTMAANTFLDADYRSMITFGSSGPQPSYRFIAASNGSECAHALFSPGANLLNINSDGFLFFFPIVSYRLQTIATFNALPNTGSTGEIAHFKLNSKFKLFGLITISKDYYNNTAYAPGSQLAIDGVPGGQNPLAGNNIEIPNFSFFAPIPDIFNFWGYVSVHTSGTPADFTFVPLGSALDVSPFTSNVFTQKYVDGFNAEYPSSSETFIAQETSGSLTNNTHIRFTARNSLWMYDEMENISNTENCSSECSPNTNFSISGDASFCTTSNPYTIPNLPTGATVTWSVSPGSIVSMTNGNTPQVTVNTINSGIFNLTANVTECNTTFTVTKNNIRAGVNWSGDVFTSPDQGLTLKSWAEGYNYIWEDSWVYWGLPGTSASQYSLVSGYTSWTPSDYFPNVTFYMDQGTLVTFAVAVTSGGCSQTLHYTFVPISNPYSYSYYSLAPNPVSSDLTIYVDDEKLKKQKIAKSPDQGIQQVIILDKLGNALLQQKYPADTRKVTMNVSSLSPDMYVAKIFNGKKWLVMKFLKK